MSVWQRHQDERCRRSVSCHHRRATATCRLAVDFRGHNYTKLLVQQQLYRLLIIIEHDRRVIVIGFEITFLSVSRSTRYHGRRRRDKNTARASRSKYLCNIINSRPHETRNGGRWVSMHVFAVLGVNEVKTKRLMYRMVNASENTRKKKKIPINRTTCKQQQRRHDISRTDGGQCARTYTLTAIILLSHTRALAHAH